MAELAAAQSAPRLSLRGMINQHPLPAYFAIAYLGAWVMAVPLALSQRGLKVIAIPDGLDVVMFVLAAYLGPFLAAFLVTAATEGRAGVGQLLRRIIQWRVGVAWYLIPLVGYPLLYGIALIPDVGAAALLAIVRKWPLIFTIYLPTTVLAVFVFGNLGEETGWRGFALPRLQLRYGPLAGTLILGGLHALWHLPVYFVPGEIVPGAFDPTIFVANTLTIVAFSLIWTWIFNNARGSILIATLVHALNDANSGYFSQLLTLPNDPWAGAAFVGVLALAIVVATRGRLGYQPMDASMSP